MVLADSSSLLQHVAERIIVAWLETHGMTEVEAGGRLISLTGKAVDITCVSRGARHRIKLKPDAYFGTDPAKINDRSLGFYRGDAQALGIETVANAFTKEPGWIFDSQADSLYYYFLALSQTEDEIRALASEPDQVFFSELAVDRDELIVLPMREMRDWFEANQDRYAARPVSAGRTTSWYRLVPRVDVQSSVAGINRVGSVFHGLAL